MREQDKTLAYSPIHGFSTMGEAFRFTPYLELKRMNYQFSRSNIEYSLAQHERGAINRTSFSFIVNNKRPKGKDTTEILNLICLAFWIYSPTGVQLQHEFGPDGYFSRLMDRFQFNGAEENKTLYTNQDLKSIKEIFNNLMEAKKKKGRINLSTIYTYYGCTSFQANVAYSLYSIALESILSCGSKGRITRTLAVSFACLQGKSKRQKNKLYRQFLKLYDFRSDIMHGKWVRRKSRTNLKMLASLSNSLRILWKEVLLNKHKLSGINQNDTLRRSYLDTLEAGFVPP